MTLLVVVTFLIGVVVGAVGVIVFAAVVSDVR